jgi:hypothetical protein
MHHAVGRDAAGDGVPCIAQDTTSCMRDSTLSRRSPIWIQAQGQAKPRQAHTDVNYSGHATRPSHSLEDTTHASLQLHFLSSSRPAAQRIACAVALGRDHCARPASISQLIVSTRKTQSLKPTSPWPTSRQWPAPVEQSYPAKAVLPAIIPLACDSVCGLWFHCLAQSTAVPLCRAVPVRRSAVVPWGFALYFGNTGLCLCLVLWGQSCSCLVLVWCLASLAETWRLAFLGS